MLQSLWLHLKDEEFNKMELEERKEEFENKTGRKLGKLIEQVVTAADSNGYDGNVTEVITYLLYYCLAGGWLGL